MKIEISQLDNFFGLQNFQKNKSKGFNFQNFRKLELKVILKIK
jgi:hypothetical protein